MNKAFVREAEFDGKAYCPRCGSLGVAVSGATLDSQVLESARAGMGESGFFCNFAPCEIAYFDLYERSLSVGDLKGGVYPKDAEAAVCACFGFTLEEIEADVREGTPGRIRELLAKSKSEAANCEELAADGRCCMTEVQRLYLRGTAESAGDGGPEE